MKFEISANALRAAATFISAEETRYYLNGVYVSSVPSGGVICIATDGRRIAAVYDQHGVAEREAILRMDWGAKSLKTMKGEAVPRRVEFELGEHAATDPVAARVMAKRGLIKGTDKLDAGVYGGLAEVAEVDGTFPDYRRVIPYDAIGKDCAEGVFGVNAKFIADCATVFSIAGETSIPDGRHIAIDRTAPGEPLFVTRPGLDTAFCVVMPVNVKPITSFPWLPVK